MCTRLEELASSLRDLVARTDDQGMHAQRAASLVELFTEVERLAVAGRTLAARRVSETRAWRAAGASSASAWMASRMGSTLAQAAAALNTAHLLDELPHVREAFLAGQLSEQQAAEITAAAAADPAAEKELLGFAKRSSMTALREHCRDVRASAAGDDDACERIRRGRYLRRWMDSGGAVRLDARLAPDDAAPLLAVLGTRTEQIVLDARRAGSMEPPEAYAADALVSLADGAGAPETVVHVHVSQSALERGHTIAGETCRIDGVGPISVAAAERFAARGLVKVLESEGLDVRRVAHAGRAIPARLRTALEVRDPTCVVPECNRRHGLEIDHIVPLAEGGRTELRNLARLCRWHHAQKTHHGWKLGGSPGAWTWDRHAHGGRRGHAGRSGSGSGERSPPNGDG